MSRKTERNAGLIDQSRLGLSSLAESVTTINYQPNESELSEILAPVPCLPLSCANLPHSTYKWAVLRRRTDSLLVGFPSISVQPVFSVFNIKKKTEAGRDMRTQVLVVSVGVNINLKRRAIPFPRFARVYGGT